MPFENIQSGLRRGEFFAQMLEFHAGKRLWPPLDGLADTLADKASHTTIMKQRSDTIISPEILEIPFIPLVLKPYESYNLISRSLPSPDGYPILKGGEINEKN